MNNELAIASEHAQIARSVYDKYVEDQLNLGEGHDINWGSLNALARKATEAEKLEKDARHAALNCTCVLPEHSCRSCRDYQRQKYGDEIPWNGE